MDERTANGAGDEPSWFALYTRARHEKQVELRLTEREFEVFLPLVSRVRQWHDRRKTIEFPMFPGYLFVRCAASELSGALQAPGVVAVVRFGNRPAEVAAEEIGNVRRFAAALAGMDDSPRPGPLVTVGERVTVVEGPLRDVAGRVVETRGERVLLQVGLEAIRQGLKIEVPAAAVRSLETAPDRQAPYRPVENA